MLTDEQVAEIEKNALAFSVWGETPAILDDPQEALDSFLSIAEPLKAMLGALPALLADRAERLAQVDGPPLPGDWETFPNGAQTMCLRVPGSLDTATLGASVDGRWRVTTASGDDVSGREDNQSDGRRRAARIFWALTGKL